MALVNDGLPEPLFLAIKNDPYSAGESDYTPSSLNAPAKKRELMRQHAHAMVQKASGRWWAFMGSCLHAMLERVEIPGAIKEQRFYALVGGKKIGGQIDLWHDGVLYDYKITSAWSVVYGKGQAKSEWVAQSNVNALLMKRNGHEVVSARNILGLRDWDDRDAKKSTDYPQLPAVEIEIPLWTEQETEDWILRRIAAHEAVQGMPPERLPDCTADERWEKPEKWAIMKEGRKTAVRVLNSRFEADLHMKSAGLSPANHSIVKRPGESTHCLRFCPAIAFCAQGQKLTNIDSGDTE